MAKRIVESVKNLSVLHHSEEIIRESENLLDGFKWIYQRIRETPSLYPNPFFMREPIEEAYAYLSFGPWASVGFRQVFVYKIVEDK